MNKSESIKELAQALAQAQEEMPAVQFNATNPFLKNKYADLGAIISATRLVLAKHGLSVSQTMTSDNERVGVTTILMHTSGEWLEDSATLPLGDERGKSLAQVAGSIVTYLRRYQWSAILGIYADEDGDGNEPQQAKQSQPAKSNGNGHNPEKASNHMPIVDGTKMAYETASKVLDSEGKPYVGKTNEELSNMSIGIGKALKKNGLDDDTRAEYQMKQDAIGVILAHRNGGH